MVVRTEEGASPRTVCAVERELEAILDSGEGHHGGNSPLL